MDAKGKGLPSSVLMELTEVPASEPASVGRPLLAPLPRRLASLSLSLSFSRSSFHAGEGAARGLASEGEKKASAAFHSS